MSLEPLLLAPPAVQIHAAAATLATLLGALVLFRPKGTPMHKRMGRLWALLMVIAATSAIFINEIRLVGPFSPIHLFIPFTYGGLVLAIAHIRRGNVVAHRGTMVGLYFGALGLAGAFTLLPGRRLHDVLFSVEAGWTPSLVAIAIVLSAVGVFWTWLAPRRRRIARA